MRASTIRAAREGDAAALIEAVDAGDYRVDKDRGQPFAARFWPDGTPRLSAYEYQGLLLSPCYADGQPGGLGCNHCHDMHGDDPDGQLREGRAGERACIDCHNQLSSDHGGHDSSAAREQRWRSVIDDELRAVAGIGNNPYAGE